MRPTHRLPPGQDYLPFEPIVYSVRPNGGNARVQRIHLSRSSSLRVQLACSDKAAQESELSRDDRAQCVRRPRIAIADFCHVVCIVILPPLFARRLPQVKAPRPLTRVLEQLREAHVLIAHVAVEPRDGEVKDADPGRAAERLRHLLRQLELPALVEVGREVGQLGELGEEDLRVDAIVMDICVCIEAGLDERAEHGHQGDVSEVRPNPALPGTGT